MAVDMDLYSRQLGTYGLETMNKLASMRVLISGMQGVGAETAKNLILAGPGSVTLHDNTLVLITDLGANFCLKESDVGVRTRAEGSLDNLKALNSYVDVSVYNGVLDEAVIENHDCVVVCNVSKTKMEEINLLCRKHRTGFIAVGVYGLACSVFVDFGAEFKVTDTDGEQPKQALIEWIVPENEHRTAFNCIDDRKLPFQVGDYVQLNEIEGLEGLNDLGPQKIVATHKQCFVLDVDATKMGKYVRGGVAVQSKQPKILSFRPYSEACQRPVADGEFCLITPDLAKFGRSEQLHIAIQALLRYEEEQDMPSPRDSKAAEQVLSLARQINEELKAQRDVEGVVYVEEVDADVVNKLCSYAVCHISPMATFLGGIVAQEIIKMTGKYSPLHQFLYFDAFEIVDKLSVTDEDCRGVGSRYDDQIHIWGKTVQARIEAMNVFLVGAGALGCEYLKGLAMMGFGCGGQITVTDMDRIEVSNLNRQFLFRREHVGKPKSLTAGQAARAMNPSIKVNAIETKVGVDTEDVLTDQFWDNLDLVVNALDNIPSRLYVDSKCKWHLKPLVESGTLGTKGNVQVIVPKMTESYGDAQDPPEDSIPLCTLRHFPNQIEHTMEWARDLFAGLFTDAVQETKKVLTNPDVALKALTVSQSPAQRKVQLERISQFMQAAQPHPSIDNCIELAAHLFHSLFNLDIAQLLFNFPVDHVTSTGVPFWSGAKRAPQILMLDVTDQTHMRFIQSAANLFAFALGLPPTDDLDLIARIVGATNLPAFEPRKVVFKVEESEEVQEGGQDDESTCQRLEARIREMSAQMLATGVDPQPIEFEKDDDTNFHIDFMAAAGNLRARNYRINEVERWRAKILAGKIIPAVATTTAMITGLACMEIIKLVNYTDRPIEHFKNAFANLSLPVWILSEPIGPKKTCDVDYDPIAAGPVKARPQGFTSWDRVVLRLGKNGTMKDMIDAISKMFEVDVTILSAGNLCIYNSFLPNHKQRLSMTIEALLDDITKNKPDMAFKKDYCVVEAACTDPNDLVDVIIPTVQCFYK